MVLRQRYWLGLGLLSALACNGSLETPTRPLGAGPAGEAADGGGAQPGGGSTPTGEAPAGLGTEVFALCEDDTEQPGPRLLRLLTRREYKNTVTDLLFVQDADVSSLPLEGRVRGFDNNATAQAVTSRHVDAQLNLGEALAKAAVERSKGQLLKCDPNQQSCARSFVESFGLRAFRRPLGPDEVERYLKLFASELTGGSFDEGMRLTINAMLVSPAFLYRSEVGSAQGDGTFKLSAYEVASALSYLFWGSMPDPALFDAAKQDALQTPAQLSAQATRMLSDPKARLQLGEFSVQWLRSESVLSANKDKAIYPSFSDSLREAMMAEQTRFFAKVVLDDSGKFETLFTPTFTVVNRELASFYGLPAPANDFDMVNVADSGRGGVLGLGAVLASHAHQNESSPIKRGLYVRDRLLCQTLPSPPANLDTTPPGLDPTLTTRARFAQHTADPVCTSCHKFIDGVGFGLEGFDGVGQRRDTENGMPIDKSGTITGVESLDDKQVHSFSGNQELAAILRDSDSAKACLALQYYRFGRGYEERKSDACSLSALRKKFEEGGLTVRDLLANLPLLKSFTIRAAD